MNKHTKAATGHVSVVSSEHGQAGRALISSLICLHKQPQVLVSPLSLCCISPLVDTLISPFCATL